MQPKGSGDRINVPESLLDDGEDGLDHHADDLKRLLQRGVKRRENRTKSPRKYKRCPHHCRNAEQPYTSNQLNNCSYKIRNQNLSGLRST
jgi:hypothetical protein